MSALAHSSRPEIQARRHALGRNAEHVRRRAVFLSAKGQNNREIAQAWLIEWREGGFAADFPELPEWLAAKRLSGWETHYERCKRLNARGEQ